MSGPPLAYPEPLRRARISGRVLIAAIISAKGMPEPSSLRIIQSDNPGFDEAALGYLRWARFRPGCHEGHAVRVRITFPLTFRIKD
jgi:TonB family protein